MGNWLFHLPTVQQRDRDEDWPLLGYALHVSPPPHAAAPLTFLPLWLFGDLLPRLPATQRGGEGEFGAKVGPSPGLAENDSSSSALGWNLNFCCPVPFPAALGLGNCHCPKWRRLTIT